MRGPDQTVSSSIGLPNHERASSSRPRKDALVSAVPKMYRSGRSNAAAIPKRARCAAASGAVSVATSAMVSGSSMSTRMFASATRTHWHCVTSSISRPSARRGCPKSRPARGPLPMPGPSGGVMDSIRAPPSGRGNAACNAAFDPLVLISPPSRTAVMMYSRALGWRSLW
jgi:hypothetical protein